METKELFLNGCFHFHCYKKDDKIRQENTKVYDTKEEITCVVPVQKGYTEKELWTDKMRGSASFFFFFFPISKHHCPYQSQVPCPKQSMKAGRMLFLFSRYLWSIWGRISQITGQCQPRLIRTLTGPALGLWTTQEGPYPQVGTCRCCLDRRLFNMLSRTRISPVALKRNRHTEPQV